MISRATAGGIARESLIAILAAIGVDRVKNRKPTRVLPKTSEAYKAELLGFIKNLENTSPKASKNFLERYERRKKWQEHGYEPGDASEFVELLAQLFRHLEDAPKEREKLFVWLGGMDDQEFDVLLTFLKHDKFSDWLKNSWRWARVNAREFHKLASRAWKSVSQNQALVEKAEVMSARAKEKRRKRGYGV